MNNSVSQPLFDNNNCTNEKTRLHIILIISCHSLWLISHIHVEYELPYILARKSISIGQNLTNIKGSECDTLIKLASM